MLRDSIAKFFKVDSLISNLTGYVETRIELVKIEAKEELARGIASVLVLLLIALVIALVIIFMSIGIAMKISESLGSLAGFGVVSAFYLLVVFTLLAFREKLNHSLEAKIRQSLNKKKN